MHFKKFRVKYRQDFIESTKKKFLYFFRCESDRNPNYQADTESAGSTESINQSNNQSINQSPIKLLRELKQKKVNNIPPLTIVHKIIFYTNNEYTKNL